jgi:hypothetical protein
MTQWNSAERILTLKRKGGKIAAVPALAPLAELLDELKRQGRQITCAPPKSPPRRWILFFESLDMPYSFHSLRVSFITRLRRAGVDRWTAMRLVGHASTTVHSIYNRYEVEQDLRNAVEKVQIPGANGFRDTREQPSRSSSRKSPEAPRIPSPSTYLKGDPPVARLAQHASDDGQSVKFNQGVVVFVFHWTVTSKSW